MILQNIILRIYQNIYQRKFSLLIACFCILLNWAGHSFVYENTYRFLTFDMIGTFVAAITLGTAWAIIVAITTPIVLANITSPHFIYLAVINMTGAIFWGWLAETGKLVIINTKTRLKNNLKQNFIISGNFILFAGVATGLIISLSSSVIKNVIFQDAIFKQPYSIYFTDLFKNIFNVSNSGFDYIFANYIAETFIEIPNTILTVFTGSVIVLTILKYNTIMLTQHYERKLKKEKISWFTIFLSSISKTEMLLMIILGYIYISTVKHVSNNILHNIISQISTQTVNDVLFLEMITIPLIITIITLFLKIILPIKKIDIMKELLYLKRTILNKKEFETDITKFIITLFILSVAIVVIYLSIIINLTGITPIKYYYSIFSNPANTSSLLWLIILLFTFILIDKYNNNLTRNITLENEFIKKQTVNEVEESFDIQRQRLQALELNWSQDTIELLRSSRHDLVNQLEKTKTGFDDLLYEVYEKIVKKYKDDILENQKKTREHLEDLRDGKLSKTNIKVIEDNIIEKIDFYNEKLKPYITIKLNSFKGKTNHLFCYTNRLLFIAINNILDNSIFALQKLLINDDFNPIININLSIDKSKKSLNISIVDNAGGLEEYLVQKIYKQPLNSSKGNRLGEGTVHSAYFIAILNGTIKAQNITINGNKGLKTDIILPLYKDF